MKNKLRRYYGRRGLHFITFSCYQRRGLLESVQTRNLFLEILAEVREEYQFPLIGYVLMPNHVHLLIAEPAQVTPSTAIQVLEAAGDASDASTQAAKVNTANRAGSS